VNRASGPTCTYFRSPGSRGGRTGAGCSAAGKSLSISISIRGRPFPTERLVRLVFDRLEDELPEPAPEDCCPLVAFF